MTDFSGGSLQAKHRHMSCLDLSSRNIHVTTEEHRMRILLPPTSQVVSSSHRAWQIMLLAMVAAVYCCGTTIADPDLWGHTKYGLDAREAGVFALATDPYSFTAKDAEWINHEWLTEWIFGGLWDSLGNLGLWLYRNVWVGIVFMVAACQMIRSRVSVAGAAFVLFFAALTLAEFTVFIRPQLATFGLFALTLTVLRNYWDESDTLCGMSFLARPGLPNGNEVHFNRYLVWLLPLTTVVWVNLHGGFLAGLAIQGLFAGAAAVAIAVQQRNAGRFFTLLAVFVLSCAATLVNPYGWRMHTMLWDHLVPEQFVREWQPLWAVGPIPALYVPFALIGAAWIARRGLPWLDVLILAVVSHQALQHVRHVALLNITVLILLPEALDTALSTLLPRLTTAWRSCRIRQWRVVFATAAVLLGLQLSTTAPFWQAGLQPWEIAVDATRATPGMPVRAVRFLRDHNLRGNLLTEYGWGQFLIWHRSPANPVAFDGRYRTVYSRRLEAAYLALLAPSSNQADAVQILRMEPVAIALLPTGSLAAKRVAAQPDWRQVYADEQACILIRQPGFNWLTETHAAHLPSPTRRWERFPALEEDGVPNEVAKAKF